MFVNKVEILIRPSKRTSLKRRNDLCMDPVSVLTEELGRHSGCKTHKHFFAQNQKKKNVIRLRYIAREQWWNFWQFELSFYQSIFCKLLP